MVDTENLRNLVEQFRFSSNPSNADSSAPCTVGDVRRVVKNIADVLDALINELEENQ